MKIGIYLIATNKYKQFVVPFLQTVDKYFFRGHKRVIYLFTDDSNYFTNAFSSLSLDVHLIEIPAYKFPYATLYRYRILTEHKDVIDCDWLFYSDVDIEIVSNVSEEILPSDGMEKLIATRHCGFYARGGGSWETNPDSFAYVAPEKRIKYWAGGFQGGKTEVYLRHCELMAKNITNDEEKKGLIPVWHDESAWNWLLSSMSNFKELTPDYCLVEQKELRVKWGVDNFEPKIVALEKNHKEIRS